ncbi:MAG: BPTI/Kunitz domain-containing protein, partial [Myxococcales bacterium]|nr:BPTI/Kunitz domain-containing protein [Myxococcales bacterium]
MPRWFFNTASGQCEEFIYGGCGGNENNFETRAQCEARCADICTLPPEVGDCDAAIPRWYYDPAVGHCAEFVYGGCGGNANNFETREACEGACGAADVCVEQNYDFIVLGGSRTFGECISGCNSQLALMRSADDPAGCDAAQVEVCDNGPGSPCTQHLGRLTPAG